MSHQQELSPKQKFLAGLSGFLIKNRIALLSLAGLIVVLLIAFAIGSAITEESIEKSTLKIEAAEEKLSEYLSAGEDDDVGALAVELFAELSAIIDAHPRHYAGQRALFLRGSFLFFQENFKEAYDDFMGVVEQFPTSYLAPLSLVYGAISMEEHDQPGKAIEAYRRILEEYSGSMEIPRTLFALGRLSEQESDAEGAKGYYNQLIDDYSSSNWTKMARNRIIWLDSQ